MAGQRGLADTHFSALSQFVDPMAQAGKFAMDYGTRIRADEKEAGLTKERADDRLLRKEENAQQQANWAKSFGLQQSAEDRAKTEQAAKEATRQAYGQYGQLLSSPNQTQAQVTEMSKPGSMLANVQAKGGVLTPAQESKLLAQYGVDVGTNKGNLTQQRQLLQEQAPVSALYGVGAAGQMTTRGDIDVSQQEALKEAKLGDINRQIEAQLGRDQALSLTKMKIAADASEGAKTRAHAAKLASTKEQPITMYKLLPDGRQVTQKVTSDAVMQKLTDQGYQVGDVSGSYRPDANGGTGAPVVPLRTDTGVWDNKRLSGVATVLQTAGLSGKDAVGLANMATDDTWMGSGVNFNKILEPAYVKLKAKDSSVTRDQVAKLLNTAF